jgi:hypothetical protein
MKYETVSVEVRSSAAGMPHGIFPLKACRAHMGADQNALLATFQGELYLVETESGSNRRFITVPQNILQRLAARRW